MAFTPRNVQTGAVSFNNPQYYDDTVMNLIVDINSRGSAPDHTPSPGKSAKNTSQRGR